VVEFGVDEGGRVYDPRVVRSSDALFDEPTLEAVRQWRFEPGRRNGRIVRFRMMLPVEFHLDQE
jgi:protein TonB